MKVNCAMTDVNTFHALERAFSHARMQTYLEAAGGDSGSHRVSIPPTFLCSRMSNSRSSFPISRARRCCGQRSRCRSPSTKALTRSRMLAGSYRLRPQTMSCSTRTRPAVFGRSSRPRRSAKPKAFQSACIRRGNWLSVRLRTSTLHPRSPTCLSPLIPNAPISEEISPMIRQRCGAVSLRPLTDPASESPSKKRRWIASASTR